MNTTWVPLPALERLVPDYQICERHAIDVDAPVETTMAAAKALDFDRSHVVRGIVRARELLMGARHFDTPRRPFLEAMRAIGWGVLVDEPHAVVMGAVTQPWKPNPVFRALSPDEFAAFREPGFVKIAWTLEVEPRDGGSCFRTETRAIGTDARARRWFRLYWSFVSPGVVLIRRAILPILKAEAERLALPGDELVPDARLQLDHDIEIDAPPAAVWPWLVQMGGQRAGWYSWDRLDNGGHPSADRILPEHQHLAVGDTIPMRPIGTEGFEVIRIDPQRALVLRSPAADFDGTWAFVLEPIGHRTRLRTRYRAVFAPTLRMRWFVPLMSAVHAVMEKKQLRTIKHHVEHVAAA